MGGPVPSVVTDRDLALWVGEVARIEALARQVFSHAGQDLAEKDAALVTLRLAKPMRTALEAWISSRACREALKA
jgi:hypothetical protein